MSTINWANYWRNCLADSESSKGTLNDSDLKNFVQIAKSEARQGRLSTELTHALFAQESDDCHVISLTFRPSIHRLICQHGIALQNQFPPLISVMSCPVWLNRSGQLFPAAQGYIPRDLLAPQDEGQFFLADVSQQDQWLSQHQGRTLERQEVPAQQEGDAQDQQHIELWQEYMDQCNDLFRTICPHFKQDPQIGQLYKNQEHALVIKSSTIKGASRHILTLYDSLKGMDIPLPLLESYCQRTITEPTPCTAFADSISLRSGHPNDQYPLASALRDALSQTLQQLPGDILAVNGPPGTGKTTFVLSVVASKWVNAALAQSMPEVIIAASTNNQAVTNIIDAFGKDFATGSGPLAGRWLPEVTSYGGYFPAPSREDDASQSYQTAKFFKHIECQQYLVHAEQHFLQRARAALDLKATATLEQVKSQLHHQLTQEAAQLAEIPHYWDQLCRANRAVDEQVGEDPFSVLAQLDGRSAELSRTLKTLYDSERAWQEYQADESLWFTLFHWIPAVAKKRKIKRNLFIAKSFSLQLSAQLQPLNDSAIEQILNRLIRDTKAKKNALDSEKATKLALVNQSTQARDAWLHFIAQWYDNAAILPGETPTLDEIDKAADHHLRFTLFRLATHYWEARWLIDTAAIENLDAIAAKTGRRVVLPRWQRRMMITPCIVSTFHALPRHMTASVHNEGEFSQLPLLNFIDLLIVDEAGQVSPEVAGASFALAKQALVIGDIHQIEPVRNLPGKIDVGNLFNCELITESASYQEVLDSGNSVVNGSVMAIAQRASKHHYQPAMEAGMFLSEHRRCLDEIISFCNQLCYQGVLEPKRGTLAKTACYPPFGYLHIDGRAEQGNGGSRFNLLEAQTIAQWLSDNRQIIEQAYAKPLEQAVAIVTPFAAQVRTLQQSCKQQNIATAKQENALTIGTVHALQGAERDLVIFSPVYSRHSDGGFIDASNSLLNVAVSRAKNSFLVFGDIDLLASHPKGSPSALLAQYLLAKESNALLFKQSSRPDLIKQCAEPQLLQNASEHDQYLYQLLASIKQEIQIVSPWIISQRLVQTGLLAALSSAVDRGINVSIFTDLHFNTQQDNRYSSRKADAFAKCCSILEQAGISVYVVDGLHSKLVMADQAYICSGSFNWLSAVRRGPYALLETSLAYHGDLSEEINIQNQFLRSRVQHQHLGV